MEGLLRDLVSVNWLDHALDAGQGRVPRRSVFVSLRQESAEKRTEDCVRSMAQGLPSRCQHGMLLLNKIMTVILYSTNTDFPNILTHVLAIRLPTRVF